MNRYLKITRTLLSALLLGLIGIFSSCSDKDPEPDNENELITTLKLAFLKIDNDGNPVGEDEKEFIWFDADAEGPIAPEIDNIILDAQSRYRLTLTVLDESKTPAEDITEEIDEEDMDHQFFFVVTGASLQIAYDDSDDNGRPVGLTNVATTAAPGQGSLRVVLRHELNKAAAGVADGNLANAGGETDLDVTFPLTIQ